MNNMHIFAFASIIAASSLMAGTLTTIVFAQGSTTEAYGAADSTVGITPHETDHHRLKMQHLVQLGIVLQLQPQYNS